MPSISRSLLQFVTFYALLGLGYALSGHRVTDVTTNAYPFVVSISGRAPEGNGTELRNIANLHICTGTLISRKSVVTAAHCLLHRDPHRIEIIAGSTNLKKGQKYYPESWLTYAEWLLNKKDEYSLNDIAVITLAGEGVNQDIRPISALALESEHLDNRNFRILGWGRLGSDRYPILLKKAFVHVISNEECSNQGTMLKGTTFNVPPYYFCTKNNPWVLSTIGDGGAPILDEKRRLIGINIGVCPKVEDYPQHMLDELQMNSHLRLYYYVDFISHVKK